MTNKYKQRRNNNNTQTHRHSVHSLISLHMSVPPQPSHSQFTLSLSLIFLPVNACPNPVHIFPHPPVSKSQGTPPLISNVSARYRSAVSITRRPPFPAEGTPVPIKQQAVWAQQLVWTLWRRKSFLASTGIPTFQPPPRNLIPKSTVLNLLYALPEMLYFHTFTLSSLLASRTCFSGIVGQVFKTYKPGNIPGKSGRCGSVYEEEFIIVCWSCGDSENKQVATICTVRYVASLSANSGPGLLQQ